MQLREMVVKRVRQARRRCDLSQAQLAERCGLSTETISRIERSRFEPALTTIVAIAKALDLPTDALLGVDDVDATAPRARSALTRQLTSAIAALDEETQVALLKLVEHLRRRDRRR